MKKLFLFIPLVVLVVLGSWFFMSVNRSQTEEEIKLAARRASVMVQFEIPVMKVSFTTPLVVEEKEKLTKESIEELISKKIEEVIVKEREYQNADKYERYLSTIEGYIIPKSKTEIPIGSVLGVPEYAEFPKKVLTVYKTEKKEISVWEKKYEEDVLSISETASVSISKAKEILINLKSKGYSISKEESAVDSEVKLLWFSGGWNDQYPRELDWEVFLVGEKVNRIRGYDDRGILKVQTIPDDSYNTLKKVYIKAGYFDLKEEYKPIPANIKTLKDEIKYLKKQLELKEKEERDRLKKEVELYKRDISKVTWLDVRLGIVKVETFWVHTAASGIFIGNAKLDNELFGYKWGNHYYSGKETKGVILTNAHVAQIAEDFGVYITKDKEKMFIVFPGYPSVKYTQDSDMFGTPASLLVVDSQSVASYDWDCGILVTSAVPQYEKHKAFLGDSDKVKEGEVVISVGNPAEHQKFLSQGVVSNKNYSLLKSRLADPWIKNLNRKWFNWLMNSNWHFDNTIGIGGSSGSGIWALSGSQRGKVIALHNSGFVTSTGTLNLLSSKPVEVLHRDYSFLPENTDFLLIIKFAKMYEKELFGEDGYKAVVFDKDMISDLENYPEEMLAHTGYVRVAGMNSGIPINAIKRYLQERGLDPDNFGFEGANADYWTK